MRSSRTFRKMTGYILFRRLVGQTHVRSPLIVPDWLTEDELTKQFAKTFSGLQIPKETIDDIVETLKANHKDKSEFHKNLLGGYQTEYQKYETRIEKMYEDKLDGSITESYYEEKRKEYRVKQKEINGKIAKLHIADEDYYLTSEYLLKLASNASKLFESSEVHEKHLLLKMTLQNLELKGKIARFDWIKPFDQIAFYASRQCWLPKLRLLIQGLQQIDFEGIIKAFQDIRYIGVLRERWNQIKKLTINCQYENSSIVISA